MSGMVAACTPCQHTRRSRKQERIDIGRRSSPARRSPHLPARRRRAGRGTRRWSEGGARSPSGRLRGNQHVQQRALLRGDAVLEVREPHVRHGLAEVGPRHALQVAGRHHLDHHRAGGEEHGVRQPRPVHAEEGVEGVHVAGQLVHAFYEVFWVLLLPTRPALLRGDPGMAGPRLA
jgi:hypothetical protein